MLKILSWNIRQGGGSRTTAIVSKLANEKADIIVLSEFRNGESGNRLRSALMKIGYRHQVVSGEKNGVNSVLIASTFAAGSELYSDADEKFTHNIATAVFPAFKVMGVYLPHKKRNNLLPYINNKVKNDDAHYIIAGDYNTGINHVDQVGKSFWYEDELIKLKKNGYVDAFRHIHGDIKEYSWYSHQGNGYRYDHTYVDEALIPIVKDCYYLNSWREEKLSDHSPMVLELG